MLLIMRLDLSLYFVKFLNRKKLRYETRIPEYRLVKKMVGGDAVIVSTIKISREPRFDQKVIIVLNRSV